MQTLIGTEKQTAWATDIRQDMILAIKHLVYFNLNSDDPDRDEADRYLSYIEIIKKIPFSDWFIDNYANMAPKLDNPNYVVYHFSKFVHCLKVAKRTNNRMGVVRRDIYNLNLI
jgi:hypothetical protein